MIYLFTDFGQDGPYLGQVSAVLARYASNVPVIALFNDLPPFDARGAAYLLSAYSAGAAAGDVVFAVVDPGVGTARRALAIRADDIWFVGPDNGLLAIVSQRARSLEKREIRWRPSELSNTFHGRDLFAPAAARLAMDSEAAATALDLHPIAAIEGEGWRPDHDAIVYFDRYGNGITGRRAGTVPPTAQLDVGGHRLSYARTFGEHPAGEAFWYANANGLIEIAASGGSAERVLGIAVGTPVIICGKPG